MSPYGSGKPPPPPRPPTVEVPSPHGPNFVGAFFAIIGYAGGVEFIIHKAGVILERTKISQSLADNLKNFDITDVLFGGKTKKSLSKADYTPPPPRK